MNMMKLLIVASFGVVVASCETLRAEKSEEVEGSLTPTEPQMVTKTEYLPGQVVVQPFPQPDSSLVPDVEPLSEEHITGDDIGTDEVLQTAVIWSGQYHDLATTYNILRGWIIGVRAGQQGIDAPPVIMHTPPDE